MDNHHHHHHHHHHAAPAAISKIFVAAIVLNLLFVVVEAVVGIRQSSLSLLSDAGHNLSDVFSLLLVLIGFGLAAMPATKRFTYGYRKSTVLISLVNAVILLVAVGVIVAEAIQKLRDPAPVNGAAISWTAAIGILINGATVYMLHRGQKADLNVRGAFLHMIADTLVSVGVVVSGIVIYYTGYTIIDPLISLVIAVVILFATWDLLRDSVRELIDGIPDGVDIDELSHHMTEIEHVAGVHHMHVWAVSTTENALTAHVVIDELDAMPAVKQALKDELREHGIAHTTLEFELPSEHCCDTCC